MSNLAEKQEVLEPVHNAIAPYDDFKAQLATLKEENAKMVFEYETPKGNASARSYIRKLASTAVAIDKRRKELGEESREYIKRVNAEGGELEAAVRAMMKPHQEAIDFIEEQDNLRIAQIRAGIDEIKDYGKCAGFPVAELEAYMRGLGTILVDASYAEFMAEATLAYEAARTAIQDELVIATKREADAAELARLREEAALQAEKDKLEKIRAEAAEKARKDAEEKADIERLAAARREAQLKADAEHAAKVAKENSERAEREKQAALAKAEQDKQAAIDTERKRAAQWEADKAAAEAKREADRKHQASIHQDIIKALASLNVDTDTAKAVIAAVRSGAVPHVKIQY